MVLSVVLACVRDEPIRAQNIKSPAILGNGEYMYLVTFLRTQWETVNKFLLHSGYQVPYHKINMRNQMSLKLSKVHDFFVQGDSVNCSVAAVFGYGHLAALC